MNKSFTTFIFVLLFSFSAFSNTAERAARLYKNRGLTNNTGRENARQAANIYKKLSKTRRNVVEKASMLTLASRGMYFYAMTSKSNRKRKMELYWNAYEMAKEAVELLANGNPEKKNPINPKRAKYRMPLAFAIYFAAANMGRWGKLKGPFTALHKWKTILKPRLKDLVRFDPNGKVELYGGNRIIGGVLNVLGGDVNRKNALEWLQEAYENTIHEVNDIEISKNMTTNVFLLEAYRKDEMVDEYCDLYDAIYEIMEDDNATIARAFPDLVPEAWYEFYEMKDEKKFRKFYRKECE